MFSAGPPFVRRLTWAMPARSWHFPPGVRLVARARPSTLAPSALTIPTPSASAFPNYTNYQLQNYTVRSLDSYWQPKASTGATPVPVSGPIQGDLSYYYLASADIVVQDVNSQSASSQTDMGNVVVRVRRVFQKETLSLWRYAIFFDDDLEIHPGAPMNINGDVHTNGSFYAAHNTLTLSGKTTYVNGWPPGFMPGDDSHVGETPQSPNWATGLPPAQAQAQLPYGTELPDYHKLIEQISDPTDPLYKYTFANQAGVTVTIDASNNIKIYNAAGKDITGKNGNDPDGRTAKAFGAALSTGQTITDNREGATTGNATIGITTLDVSVIQKAMDSSDPKVNFNIQKNILPGTTVNNVIYIVDTSADPNGVTSKRGIRLINGGVLPDGGLTVVSGNPIYVQGDYNTGTVPSGTQPASNSGDPATPTVDGYNRQPAAIMADAVNILSNSWQDSKSGTNPVASNTTVNAAMVSGNVPTADGNYSGGVENFPRFLENWSGKSLTYYGSMIELYPSKQSIGKWGAANVYSPPNRSWYFDTNFITTPPPGLLVTYNYNRSRWYTQ